MVALFVMLTIATLIGLELVVGRLEGRKLVVVGEKGKSATSVEIPENTLFHRGHSWARMENDGSVTVGVDDFARRMTGRADAVMLPKTGARMIQGEKGMTLRRNGRDVSVVAPMDGQVMARNEAALADPAKIESDPYGEGWLLKIWPECPTCDRRNLLEGWVATRWMDESYRRLSRFFAPELGEVLQDGGEMTTGIMDSIATDRFDEAMREFFLA